jgi:hypothetical protein
MPKELNIVKSGDYSKSGCIMWWSRNRYDQSPYTSRVGDGGHLWYLIYIERCKNTHARLKIGTRIENMIKQAGYIYNREELNYEIVYDQDEITQEYNLVKTLKPLFQSVDV